METGITECHCNRCGFIWKPMWEHVPKRCAGCKSPYWNKPRVRNLGGNTPEIINKDGIK